MDIFHQTLSGSISNNTGFLSPAGGYTHHTAIWHYISELKTAIELHHMHLFRSIFLLKQSKTNIISAENYIFALFPAQWFLSSAGGSGGSRARMDTSRAGGASALFDITRVRIAELLQCLHTSVGTDEQIEKLRRHSCKKIFVKVYFCIIWHISRVVYD